MDGRWGRRGRGPHGDRDQRGAALVEFALVVPIFCALLFGIIDFANAFNNANSVRQGVREGARQAVVANWSVGSCTNGSEGARIACVTKDRIGLRRGDTAVKVVPPAQYRTGQMITVCAMYKLDSITGLLGPVLNNRVIKSKITMRVEQVDTAATPATLTYADAPIRGDWAWCS
jgi:hypothetical protein